VILQVSFRHYCKSTISKITSLFDFSINLDFITNAHRLLPTLKPKSSFNLDIQVLSSSFTILVCIYCCSHKKPASFTNSTSIKNKSTPPITFPKPQPWFQAPQSLSATPLACLSLVVRVLTYFQLLLRSFYCPSQIETLSLLKMAPSFLYIHPSYHHSFCHHRPLHHRTSICLPPTWTIKPQRTPPPQLPLLFSESNIEVKFRASIFFKLMWSMSPIV
jgi:hypothetical protein